MRSTLKEFYHDVARRKAYWLPVLLFAIIAYAFSMTNRTVSVDGIAADYYVGSGRALLSATRWGTTFLANVLSMPSFSPFVNSFLGVCFLITAATLLACIVYFLFHEKNVWLYTIFTSIFVTYPLLNEIFVFDFMDLIIGVNLTISSLVILFQLTYTGKYWKRTILSAIPLTLVVSGYESIIFVYITAVLICLFCKYVIRKELCEKLQWLKEGIGFAIPLFIAVALRIIIGVLLIRLLGLEFQQNGASSITWFFHPFLQNLVFLIKDTISMYGLHALIYFPITIFLVAAIVFFVWVIILTVKQRRVLPLLLGGLVFLSLFLQSILQGTAIPYRTAQTIDLFVAFVAIAVVWMCCKSKHGWLRATSILLGLWLCLHQSVYLNYIFALNNLRSENELAVVHQIGYRLESTYDKKLIVFSGSYDLGDWISSEIQVDTETAGGKVYEKIWKILNPSVDAGRAEIVDSNVNSVLNWSMHAYGSQRYMKELFSYCGYDIEVLEDYPPEIQEQYDKLAAEEGMRPLEIRDMGDYLLVYLGNTEDSE